MSLYILTSFPRKGATPREDIERKFKFMVTFLDAFKDYFYPSITRMWLGPPLEALGGDLLSAEKKYPSFPELAKIAHTYVLKEEDCLKLSVDIEGDLLLPQEKKEFSAHLSLHNLSFRKTYGDFEFNIYATEKFEDISDLILISKELCEALLNALNKLVICPELNRQIRLEKYFAAPTSDGFEDMTERTIAYHKREYEVLIDIFRTIRFKIEEKNIPEEIRHFLIFYKDDAIARRLWEDIAFKGAFEDILRKMGGELRKSGSILLVAKEKNTNKKFFDDLSIKLISAFKELPNDEEIIGKIKRWVLTKGKKVEEF